MESAELTEETFDTAVADGVALVDFWATWCGPCKIMGAVLESEVVPALEGKARIFKVNVENSPNLAARFGITAIPAILVFRGGRLVESLVGVQKPETLISAAIRAGEGV